MYEKILVPLDGSELSQLVIPYVEEVSRGVKSEIILLRVSEEGEADGEEVRRSYLERMAKSITAQVGLEENVIRCEIVRGHPADEILSYAEQKKVDLIAMSTHGRSGVSRWLLGSVASKVIGAASAPVLAVRAKAQKTVAPEGWLKRKIVVPLDGSKLAELAIRHVNYFAEVKGAEVVLIRAYQEPEVPSDRSAAIKPSWEEYRKQVIAVSHDEAANYLDAQKKVLTEKKLRVGTEVVMGDPAIEIIKFVEGKDIDLLALTTHGRSGIGKFLYGSVASKLIHTLPVPILLINARAQKSKA